MATITLADLEKQIEGLRTQIGEARQTLAERLVDRDVLATKMEEARNGQAPSAAEAEKNYALNESTLNVLRVQITEMAATAANLEQQRLDQIYAATSAEDSQLKSQRREALQAIKDAQQADDAIAMKQDAISGRLALSQQDADEFRNSGGRGRFIAELVGEVEHAQGPDQRKT